MDVREECIEYLKRKGFKNVRETSKGLRINVEKLDRLELSAIADVPCTNKLEVRRSGTGLVIVIED